MCVGMRVCVRVLGLTSLFTLSLQVLNVEHKAWWEEFMGEFFHENATLAIEVDLGEGVQKFCEYFN